MNQQMDELEFKLIAQALQESEGRPILAAIICGLSHSTFKMKMHKLGLKAGDFR